MDTLRITWIAPEIPGAAPLSWLAEIGDIAAIEGVHLNLVTGPKITRAQVAQALRHRHDLTVWSGHGAPGGLQMPDLGMIAPKWIATQARCGLPRLIVLAACGSQLRDDQLKSMTEEISRQGLNAVGFPASTEDPAAVLFNVELARALVAGATVGNAFDVALEAISHTATAKGVFLTPGLTNGYRDVVVRMEALEAGQHELRDGVRLIMDHLGIQAPPKRRHPAAAPECL